MSAPSIRLSEVGELAKIAAEEAAEEAAKRAVTKEWADLWPVVEPFLDGPKPIQTAVQFLIDQGTIEESQRSAAYQGLHAKRKRENQKLINEQREEL